MKKLLFILLALPIVALGQSTEPQTREELQLIEKIYYDRNVYIFSDEDMSRLNKLVADMRADSTLKIHIVGYADRWGGDAVNDRFSYVRAMWIADWMRSCRVPREQIVFVGRGIDREAPNDKEARRVEISHMVSITITPEPKPAPKPKPAPEPKPKAELKPEPKPEPKTEPEPQPEPKSEPKSAPAPEPTSSPSGSISLRTNLLYWLTGMINLGAEWRPGDSPLGVVLSGGYSPIGGADWAHAIGGWYVSPELRYYIPSHEEWFVGCQLLAQGFNYKLGETGYQGTMYGGGVAGGYKLRLTDLFDMDFTLGVGYAKLDYDRYYHSNGVNVLDAGGLSKGTFIPIHAGVNLIWKIK